MNPFGIFDAMAGGLDMVGQAFGRKPRQESKRNRITFAVVYSLLLLLGLGAVVFTVWRLYFQS